MGNADALDEPTTEEVGEVEDETEEIRHVLASAIGDEEDSRTTLEMPIVQRPEDSGDLDSLCGLNPRDFAKEGTAAYILFDKLAGFLPDRAVEANRILKSIWDQVATLPNLRPIVPALVAELKRRFSEGVRWDKLTEGLHLKVPVEAAFITVADVNGYTDCLGRNITPGERETTAKAIYSHYKAVADSVGAALVEVIGDAGVFVTFNSQQQGELERVLHECKIPMKIESLEGKLDANGDPVYPERHFTLTVGSWPTNGAGLQMSVHATDGTRNGCVVVQGAAYEAAVAFQTQVRKTQGRNVQVRADGTTIDYEIPPFLRVPEMPKETLLAIKAIQVLLSIIPSTQVSEGDLLESALSFGTEGETVDISAPRLESYYLVLNLDEEAGGDIDAFLTDLTDCGTGSDVISFLKPVGAHELHFWTGVAKPEKLLDEFRAFSRRIGQLAQKYNLSFQLSGAHETALQLIKPQGGVQLDPAGSSILATVRANQWLRAQGKKNIVFIDESAVEALGIVGAERTTFWVKGEKFTGVLVNTDAEGRIIVPEVLIGREREQESIRHFIDNLGHNGVSLCIRKPSHAVESGYGESALLRYARRYAEKAGFKDDELIELGSGENLLKALPNPLPDRLLLFLDRPTSLSAEEVCRLDRFLLDHAGLKVGLVHNGCYEFQPQAVLGETNPERNLSQILELTGFDPEKAADLVFIARPEFDSETDRPQILRLLSDWSRERACRPLIHNFARALRRDGTIISLDHAVSERVWAGEWASHLDRAGLGDMERMVLGVVAEMGVPVSKEDLGALVRGANIDGCIAALSPEFVCREGDLIQLADPNMRSLRVLAGALRPMIRARLAGQSTFMNWEAIESENLNQAMVQLEHALDDSALCIDERTLGFVYELGHRHLVGEKNFAAGYRLYHRFYAALSHHGKSAEALSKHPNLVHDLAWAFTQTGSKADLKMARNVIQDSGLNTPELTWRLNWSIPNGTMGPEHLESGSFPDGFDEIHFELIRTKIQIMDGHTVAKGRFSELERVLALASSFEKSARELQEGSRLRLAFEAAALSRRAFTARLCALLAGNLKEINLHDAAWLSQRGKELREAVLQKMEALKDGQTEVSRDHFDMELAAMYNSFLAKSMKYLHPIPAQKELDETQALFTGAKLGLRSLSRPSHFDLLDTADVSFNNLNLFWHGKMKNWEDNGIEAGDFDGRFVATSLDALQGAIKPDLEQAMHSGMLAHESRLLAQQLNVLELKLRLDILEDQKRDDLQSIITEYRRLAGRAYHLDTLLKGRASDYVSLNLEPLIAKLEERKFSLQSQ